MFTTFAPSTAITVLGVAFGMNLLARGVGETYAIFLLPLGDEFNWSRSELTSVYSVLMVAQGFASPLAGSIADRFGPQGSYLFGLVCLGGGYLLAARLDSLWQFYLCVGVLGGIGAASLGMIPTQVLISRWFRTRLATAIGVAYAGLGSGIILIVPLTQIAIDDLGWRGAYTLLGTVLLSLVLLIAIAPWDKWWRKRREAPPIPAPPQATGVDHEPRPGSAGPRVRSLRDALRERIFWGLFGILFFTSCSIFSLTIQLPAYLVSLGYSAVAAATAFGALGLLSTAGMVLSGSSVDRIGRRSTATAAYIFTLAGLALFWSMAFLPAIGILVFAVAFFGVSMGSRGPIVSELAARLYPGGRGGGIYGVLVLGMGFGAGAGSQISGLLFDWTGGYAAVFAFSMASALLGMAWFWLIPALATGKRQRGA